MGESEGHMWAKSSFAIMANNLKLTINNQWCNRVLFWDKEVTTERERPQVKSGLF